MTTIGAIALAWLMPWRAAKRIRQLREALDLALGVMVTHMERDHPDWLPPPDLHVVK